MTRSVARRAAALCVPIGVAAALAGCAGVQVRSLATGQVEVQAFELRGRALPELRAQAAALCAGGGTVLRESAASQPAPPNDSRLSRWAAQASALVLPPERSAELVVRCDIQTDRTRLAVPGPALLAPSDATPRTVAAGRATPSTKKANAAADAAVPYGY